MFLAGSPISDTVSGELNPFFISFLSIISGMLSQQAYEKISTAGSRLLATPQEETPRYVRASVLIPAMKRQKKTPSDLVPYVSETEAKINEWFTEKEEVSEVSQSIISAWLGISIRELFTEQKGPEADQVNEKSESDGKKVETEPDSTMAKGAQEEAIPEKEDLQPEGGQEDAIPETNRRPSTEG